MILEKNEIAAVIFDLDGTLFDSMGMWKEIDIEFLGRFGIELPVGLQSCIEGMSFSETAVYFKERFSIPMELDEMKQCWNEMAMYKYRYETFPKPGAKEFVHRLRKLGIPIAIASSNSRPLINAVLENNGMSECFDTIVISCEVPRGKPAPDVYLLAAERLNVNPEKCLVFEDIIPGIQGGKSAGMKVIAVEDDYSLQSKEGKKQLADGYIVSYDEIELR